MLIVNTKLRNLCFDWRVYKISKLIHFKDSEIYVLSFLPKNLSLLPYVAYNNLISRISNLKMKVLDVKLGYGFRQTIEERMKTKNWTLPQSLFRRVWLPKVRLRIISLTICFHVKFLVDLCCCENSTTNVSFSIINNFSYCSIFGKNYDHLHFWI